MGAKFKCPDDNITFSAVRRFQAGMAPQAIVDELVGLNVDRACAEKVVARVVESFGKPSEEALQQERQTVTNDLSVLLMRACLAGRTSAVKTVPREIGKAINRWPTRR